MYLKVDSFALLNSFNDIWMECWLEKGYALENEDQPSDQYIITDMENRKVGTIEFKPYSVSPDNNINTVFPFNEIEMIRRNPESVVEIDKVAILKKYRGKNLERLLSLFVHYTEERDIRYCVVLLERLFYKSLKNVYKIPLEALSGKVYYKGDYIIPAVIFPERIYHHKEQFNWLHALPNRKLFLKK